MAARTIQQLLQETTDSLQASDSPKLDAELLLGHALDQHRAYLYTHPERELSASELEQFSALVARRLQGEPIAYITGKREFWNLELRVTPAVLVPRPETELLVEAALELIDEGSATCVADLGTGSGAIAIALAKDRPDWRVIAIDNSAEALEVAQANARLHGLDHIEFNQASWCDGLSVGALDLIAANPPYVAPDDPHLCNRDLRFEPMQALRSGEAGYGDLFAIATAARDHLKPGGWLLLEHGFAQHEKLSSKLQELGYTNVSGRKDLAGHWRMVQAQHPHQQ